MADFSRWLESNIDALVEAAVARLSPKEAVIGELVESVEAFFDGLLRSSVLKNPIPLNTILIDWVEASSAPTQDDLASFLPVLATLKAVTWEQIVQRAPQDEAATLLVQSDEVFTEAIIYLSKLETEAVLNDIRSQLESAQAHIKRLDKSKSNFIAVAAHELRTPLTLVEGYADMIGGTDWAKTDPSAPTLLTGIRNGTERLREIIGDMIDVSMLDLRLMELHLQPVWLTHVINALERNILKALGHRRLTIVIERESIPGRAINADPDRILQVLQKVVLNAVKYTPDGGTVTVRGRELPGFLDIMVTDNGIGIAPANLSRIFDTFSALGDSALHSSGKTKFKGGGPGLGLPIAKGIIEAHGGTIWAESDGYDEQKCPGSTFHIMIPMHPVQSGATMMDMNQAGSVPEDES